MIYLVSNKPELFESKLYKTIDVKESLRLLSSLDTVGLDTETTGLDCHVHKLLSLQLGCNDFQVVIDTLTIDILEYKNFLESDRLFIIQNARFDLKWLYRYDIIPKRVYDTMLAEKVRWLGYPIILKADVWNNIKCNRYDFVKDKYILLFSLKKLCKLYLDVDMDKTVRGKIIYQGLNDSTIEYSALDVKYLEAIMNCQLKEQNELGLLKAVGLENSFVRVIAYAEFCGVRIDVDKWKLKMSEDKARLDSALAECRNWIINYYNSPAFTKGSFIDSIIHFDRQGDLFTGFNLDPIVTINWKSPLQTIKLFSSLGVNCTSQGENTTNAKVLAPQKYKCGLIKHYLDYKESEKVVSTYGVKFLNQINPETGRVYTNYNPLGTDTCRVSSGGKDKEHNVEYLNLLNLPKDSLTRSCFIANEGNKWISIDYSGQESFIMADIANDKAMIEELMEGGGDLHSLTARMVFEEIPNDFPIPKIKEQFHELRGKAKGYEFAFNYGGNEYTIMGNFGLSKERAKEIYDNYMKGFYGLQRYQEWRKKDWKIKGYIDLNPKLGYRANIYDYNYLKKIDTDTDEPGFWEYYNSIKKTDPNSYTVQKVEHLRRRIKDTDKQSINYCIQHTGALMFKIAMIKFFNWIIKEGLFKKVLLTIIPYDECNCEAPNDVAEKVASKLHEFMVDAGNMLTTHVKLDADISRLDNGELPTYWIH